MNDPDTWIRRTYGNRRLLILVVTVVLGYGAFNLFAPLWSQRDGVATADPFTYLQFARNLAQGHFYLRGPLAEGIAALHEQEALAMGPIWNTNVRGDGQTLFTVAVGYPLFLAALWKGFGLWVCLHVNALLLLALVLLVGWVVWEGTDRSPTAAITGGVAALLLVRSEPQTFQQFMDPWREPLFYVCILGGVCGVLRFMRAKRLLPLAVAGLLMGYACSVKEANVLYGAWLGVCLLASPAFRTYPRKGLALGCFAGAGLVGLLPLLIQNHLSTGQFYLSLQFMRATQEYSVSDPGAGMSTGNAADTFRWYLTLYGRLWLFSPLFLVAALFGAAANLRHAATWILAGMLGLHVGLYVQWGNADFRHMYFAHIPYAIFLAMGLRRGVEWGARRAGAPDVYVPWLLGLGLLALAMWPSPWRILPPDERPLQFEQARALARRIDARTESRALILSNRVLRDVLAIHSRHPVARLTDVERFDPDGNARTVLEYYRREGFEILFLDNVDKDPRNAGRRDWSRRDRKTLLHHFDLEEVEQIPAETYRLRPLLDRDVLTLYRVAPWSRTVVERTITTADGEDAAFLYVQPRSLGHALRLQVGGRPVAVGDYPYVPLHGIDAGGTLKVRAEAEGVPLPALADLQAIGWTEPIRLDCGQDALPDDRFLYPKGPPEGDAGSFRYFVPEIPLRLPVRTGPGLFTTVGLGVNAVGTATGTVEVTVQSGEQPEQTVIVAGGRCYFPVLPPADQRWAGAVDVTVRTRPPLTLKLSRVRLFPSATRLAREVAPGGFGVGVKGFLTPAAYGPGPHPWRLTVNGVEAASGVCMDDPGRILNDFALVLTEGTVENRYELAFSGAGLIKTQWIDIGERLEARAGTTEAAVLWSEGFYPPERGGREAFCWSDGRGVVRAPVGPDASAYRLTLDLMDGFPGGAARELTLRMGEVQVQLPLPKGRAVRTVELSGIRAASRGVSRLELITEAWVPAEVLPPSGDTRRLGFQLYGLQWAPVAGVGRSAAAR